MQEVLSYLHSIYPLEDELEKYLRAIIRTHQLAKDAFFVKEGNICRRIAFIETGIVRAYHRNDDGSDVTNFFMKQQDLVVSIKSFFTQTPSREIIQALEPTTIYTITHEEFRHAHRTYRGFDALRGDLLEKYYLLAEEREEMRQQQDTYARFCFLVAHYPDLIDRVANKHLASFINTTPEYFSEIKRKYLGKKRTK